VAETNEISFHLVKVYVFLKKNSGWHTARKIAAGATVADRTARAHVLKMVQLGIVDQAEVFPAHHYRLSNLASKRNKTFVQRIEEAMQIFGLSE
jgi:hypothetical protein